jgi:hypothetical protein
MVRKVCTVNFISTLVDEMRLYGQQIHIIDANQQPNENYYAMMRQQTEILERINDFKRADEFTNAQQYCRLLWNMLMILVLVVALTANPYIAVFHELWDAYWLSEICVNVLFTVDVVLSCFIDFNWFGKADRSKCSILTSYLRGPVAMDLIGLVVPLAIYISNPDVYLISCLLRSIKGFKLYLLLRDHILYVKQRT